jgi:hypothetical protein
MELSKYQIDEIFDFEGTFGMPSKCGLKIKRSGDQTIVFTTELYKENPGTSITSNPASLAMQICKRYQIDFRNLVYLECAPGMNSKLNFYEEQYFKVDFEIIDTELCNPTWTKINENEKVIYL